ncbi:MAG: amidohydrolase family protein [Pseudomonadota bacterium]
MINQPLMRRCALPALLMLAAACGREPATETPSQSAPRAASATPVTIYAGGPIYTGVDGEIAQAVAVSEGEIIAVGDLSLIEGAAGPRSVVIDFEGAAMYPGFVDAHAHLIGIGQRELVLNLEGTPSLAALVQQVAETVENTEDGQVVYGRGWIETGWPEGRMPNRDDLDAVSPDNPVILTRADGHALVANSSALDAAGVNDETPDPAGGRIERDDNGRATGILIDNAEGLVLTLIDAPDEAAKTEAYKQASTVYTAYGWTGLHNMSVNPQNLDLIERLSDEGALALRVYNSLNPSGLDMLAEQGAQTNANGRVVTRAVKLYMDGALGSRGALLTSPYADQPETSGLLLMEKPEAMAYFAKALTAGIQINTHAIGDEANRLLLDWYEEAFTANPEAATDARWRDEHTQILHTEDIPRYAELGVIASMQPSHAIGDLFFAPDRLGPDRLDGAYAWRSLIDAGAVVAGGSDAPVERGDPLIEFYAAVARRGLDGTQTQEWRPDQSVTRAEALKMFTIWPAYASFAEDRLGTIEPGKSADFTVFSQDIMTIPEADILKTKALMTIIEGDIVYDGRNSVGQNKQ